MVINLNKKTIWLDNIEFSNPRRINRNKEVDVLIIGGGITGLSTAYHLMNSNLKVYLVESNLIGHGISSRTTGKLTYLQENIYSKLKEKAYDYYCSQVDAIKIVDKIVNTNNIECDYTKVDSIIYTDNNIDLIKDEEKMLNKLKINYSIINKLPYNIKCNYGIKVSNTRVFHPIKYLVKLKEIVTNNGIEVFEKSKVTHIEKKDNKFLCHINNKVITAKKIVIASHYPFFILPYLLPLKTYIEKSYISATKVNYTDNISGITVSKPVTSFRYHNDYLIYLNGTHNLCNKYDNKNNFDNLLNDLNKLNLKPDYIWSNQDIMTEDNLPYIGYIDDNILIGTGYNTWGMTNGSLAGKIISDLIQNKDNKYTSLFDPKRSKKTNIIKYPLYISYSVKSLIENKVIKNKTWYKSNVILKKIDGKNVGIYIDEHNKKHIVHNLCPHLKCSLIFNEVEKTWDCPCHGSRFDIDGNCIIGPSNKNIGFNNK